MIQVLTWLLYIHKDLTPKAIPAQNMAANMIDELCTLPINLTVGSFQGIML